MELKFPPYHKISYFKKCKIAQGATIAEASLTQAILSIYDNAEILYSYTESSLGLTFCDLDSEGLSLAGTCYIFCLRK